MLEQKDVIGNKNQAIKKLSDFLDDCIIRDEEHLKKANLLSYWIKNYTDYIEQEETFNSLYLTKFKRGSIIKANLGFNVGNEEGGLHYCIVLDKKNSKSCSTLTVIPLTSLKPNKKLSKTSVFLGDELYINLSNKNKELIKLAREQVEKSTIEINELYDLPENTEEEKIIKSFKITLASQKVDENKNRLDLITKIYQELEQMKSGSVALINQITTISKQRIYNPKKDFDILSGIEISTEKMTLIDEKIKKLYIN